MQKAVNRFWDWLFHPGIRWYHYPKGKASWFRYPSPGNIVPQKDVDDYKTPFEYSPYNIRYKRPVQSLTQRPIGVFIADGINKTVIDKLRDAGLLSLGNNTQQQIQQAKKKFQQTYGFPADQRVYRNNTDFKLPQANNRQSMRQYIQHNWKGKVKTNKNLNMPNINRRFIQQPDRMNIQTLDMFTSPHFQQCRVQVNYKLDNQAKQNAKRGYIEIRKGQKSFWKAIDMSNDPKNIQKVQRATGDDQPLNYNLRNTKIQFELDQKGNAVDVHPKTKGL